ncbi:MAG: aminotransferase class IV [Muribaculaceae bacterium]|nr:aminotransferase class IV [Muribaculaceae bacterium]
MKDSTFVETIRIADGEPQLIGYHQQRLRRTILEAFGSETHIDLRQILSPRFISGNCTAAAPHDTLKCRIVYSTEIRQIDIQPYVPKEIKSLRIVSGEDIDYHLKKSDRCDLTMLASVRGDCDEIIISRNGGIITDTSYSNLVFVTVDRQLLTPSDPLLKGVMRQSLLDSGIIKEARLRCADITSGKNITHAVMINAMLPLDISRAIPIDRIKT